MENCKIITVANQKGGIGKTTRIQIYDTNIPNTVKVDETNYSSVIIMEFDEKNKAAFDYTALAREVIGYGKEN